ncbi:hypothetical protein FS935_22225 [Metabacillus litoralis]|uniref:Uncharacterized protein n=1 Tax=Metabacillus litoralis TaxID=152268 RepID=A0A5C6V1W7_9BACI|nr:hypothetical protein [Metabacillus litoralis]TXC79014.1 hypothetical protein FS935_22225 [Metabacillus litoralis]
MKIGLGVIIGTVVLITVYGGTFTYNSMQPVKIIEGHGKHEVFSNVEEMEKGSKLIVIGQRLSKEDTTILDDGFGGVMGGYTISDFKVKKVVKNTTDHEFEKKDVIQVLENAAIETNLLGKKVSYFQEGYELMKKGKHYVLFLDESNSDPGTFIPVGAIYGKAPLEASGGTLEFKGDDEHDDHIKEILKKSTENYKKEFTSEN